MKKILFIIVFFATMLCVDAKTVSKDISIGYSEEVVCTNFGKPNIETEDSEGILTWVYNDKLPANIFVGDTFQIANSVFVVKFDNENKVKSYSYKLNLDMEK